MSLLQYLQEGYRKAIAYNTKNPPQTEEVTSDCDGKHVSIKKWDIPKAPIDDNRFNPVISTCSKCGAARRQVDMFCCVQSDCPYNVNKPTL